MFYKKKENYSTRIIRQCMKCKTKFKKPAKVNSREFVTCRDCSENKH